MHAEWANSACKFVGKREAAYTSGRAVKILHGFPVDS